MQRFVTDSVPERFVEVDAARLLLILVQFASGIDDKTRQRQWFPSHDVVRHFTPEYYLHKIDFLVRYPGFLAYELIELHNLDMVSDIGREEIMELIRKVLRDRAPELMTLPFRKFWRGAYERLDEVEAWWHSRRLVYRALEPKGSERPQKHYFITTLAESEASRLVSSVSHARWYADRIKLIYRFFGKLSAADVKNLQYSHREYREAQLDDMIPDLPFAEIVENFSRVFGEPLGVEVG